MAVHGTLIFNKKINKKKFEHDYSDNRIFETKVPIRKKKEHWNPYNFQIKGKILKILNRWPKQLKKNLSKSQSSSTLKINK